MARRRWITDEYFIIAAEATAEQIGPDALAAVARGPRVDGRSQIGWGPHFHEHGQPGNFPPHHR